MNMTDWDVEIDDSQIQENSSNNGDKTAFVILPAGNYKFTIAKVEHSTYQPKPGKETGITAPCKLIKLFVIVDGGALGKAGCDDNLYAWPSCLFRAIMVLKSIGEIQDGFKGALGDHFDALKGGEGVCKIKVEKYTKRDGSAGEKNVIERYYKPSEKVELASSNQTSSNPSENFDDIPF